MKNEYIVIVGCGRWGAYLANILSKNRHHVVIIDKDENSFERLESNFNGTIISANVEELDVLLQAKMDKADLVIASTESDSTNLMIGQIAKKIYNVPRVIVRVYDPIKVKLFKELDIEIICPTVLAAGQLIHSL